MMTSNCVFRGWSKNKDDRHNSEIMTHIKSIKFQLHYLGHHLYFFDHILQTSLTGKQLNI